MPKRQIPRPKSLKRLHWIALYALKQDATTGRVIQISSGQIIHFDPDPELAEMVEQEFIRRDELSRQRAAKQLKAAESLLPAVFQGDHSSFPLRQRQVLDVLFAAKVPMTQYQLWRTLQATVWPNAMYQNVWNVLIALQRKQMVGWFYPFGPKDARGIVHPVLFETLSRLPNFHEYPYSSLIVAKTL